MEQLISRFALQAGFSPYDLWSRLVTDAGIPGQEPDLWLQPALIRLAKGATDEGRVQLSEVVRQGLLRLDGPDEAALREYLGMDQQKGLDSKTQNPVGTLSDTENGAAIQRPPVTEKSTFYVYWRVGDDARIVSELVELLELFQIIQRSAPIRAGDTPVSPLIPPTPEMLPDTTPIVAVIDDGIGFLNARFRRDKFHTRFHVVWLRAKNYTPNPPYGQPHPQGGIVLYRTDIDAILALGDTLIEGEIYAEINRSLVPVGAHPSLQMSFTHGTFVTDLAAGDDPAAPSPAGDWALIGVQLPSDEVNQTAGWDLAVTIPHSLRWILAEVLTCSNKSPLNINLSFGSFAGPKNGGGEVEAQIANDLEIWQTAYSRRAQITYSFGNFRRSNMAAFYKLAGKLETIAWRLQPDNGESAFMEIYASPPDSEAELSRLRMEVVVPGLNIAQTVAPLPVGGWVLINDATGAPVAVMAHVPAVTYAGSIPCPEHYLLCVLPTKDRPAKSAPPGYWRLRLQSTDHEPLAIRMEVQRGDTPTGYPRDGRQSYLDHTLAYEWEQLYASFTLPAPNCPITRWGTHTAFVTAPSAATLSVSAARGNPTCPPDQHIAAPYSSLGSPMLGTQPDASAYGDRSAGQPGILAAGTFSGGVRAMDGSSAAAPSATRCAVEVALANNTPLLSAAEKAAVITDLIGGHGIAVPAAEKLSLGDALITDMEGAL